MTRKTKKYNKFKKCFLFFFAEILNIFDSQNGVTKTPKTYFTRIKLKLIISKLL